MNIFFIYEGGVLVSENKHYKDAYQDLGGAKIVYLNPVIIVKYYLYTAFNIFLKKKINVTKPFILDSTLRQASLTLFTTLILILSFFSTILIIVPLALIFKYILKWKKYIYKMKNLKISGVKIGDSVISSALRSKYSNAIVEDTIRFNLIVLIYLSYLLAVWNTINLISIFFKISNLKKFHWVTDGVYINNGIRRVLSNQKSIEIRYTHGKLKYNHKYMSCKELELEHRYIDNNKVVSYSSENYSKASLFLNKLIDKKVESELLTTEAFSKTVDLKDVKKITEPSAVLFMHRLADGQFAFGVDEYMDISEWQDISIENCQKTGINVYIRPHPEMIVVNQFSYPSEIKYLQKLNQTYSVDINQLANEPLLETNQKGVYFISPFITPRNLENLFEDYLCLTHHGSVAVESAFLGHDVISSTASPYDSKIDNFIDFYSSKHENEELIKLWKLNRSFKSEIKKMSVLNFVLRNNIRYKFL